jgi:hypothetical protein
MPRALSTLATARNDAARLASITGSTFAAKRLAFALFSRREDQLDGSAGRVSARGQPPGYPNAPEQSYEPDEHRHKLQ